MAHDELRSPNKDIIRGEIHFSESAAPPSAALPFHYHDHCEIFCSLTASIRYRVNDRVYDLHDGDLLLLNPFDVHQSLAPVETPYHRRIVLFYPDLVRGWSTGNYDLLAGFERRDPDFSHLVRLRADDRERFEATFARGRRALRLSRRTYAEALMDARIALAEILFLVSRADPVRGPEERSPGRLDDERRRRLDSLLAYIDSRLQYDLSLDSLASVYGASPSTLNRLFRDAGLLSVHQFVVERRLSQARLLLSRGTSVTEAAMESGFGNLSHFVRTFGAKTGRSPKEYQRLVLRST